MANETPEISKVEQRLDSKLNTTEDKAKAAALSAVNTTENWWSRNWKSVLAGAVAAAILGYVLSHV